MNGADIFKRLLCYDLDFLSFDWLEDRGLSDFEILISVVLTQNTNWNNVVKALANLKHANITHLDSIKYLSNNDLAILIKPSGFYNIKAKRIKTLVESILLEFGELENFKHNVSREWLLNIKGLGYESVDSILNYLCRHEILVVDSYTQRLANALGYEFDDYEELRYFFQSGVQTDIKQICESLGKNAKLYELYQIFHALIVAFGKECFKGKNLNEKGINIIKDLKIIGI